jgi:hypothetical protein
MKGASPYNPGQLVVRDGEVLDGLRRYATADSCLDRCEEQLVVHRPPGEVPSIGTHRGMGVVGAPRDVLGHADSLADDADGTCVPVEDPDLNPDLRVVGLLGGEEGQPALFTVPPPTA